MNKNETRKLQLVKFLRLSMI